MVVNGLVALDADDVDHAYGLFTRATDIADRFTDPDLSAIARLSTGEALIQRHEVAQGVRLLDEVMAGVITDEVSPVVVGDPLLRHDPLLPEDLRHPPRDGVDRSAH